MLTYEHAPFDYTPPDIVRFWALTAPLRFYFDPVFEGLDNLDPATPSLMVGNHTLFGVVDVPLLLARVYRDRGVMVRSLADHAHYDVPVWRSMLDAMGAVEGTRENCARLMEQGSHILVFPGGAREVAKRKDEKYKLVWKNRFGFVHMAVKYGYPIVPFAAVGPDDMVDIIADANDVIKSPLGKLLKRTGALDKDGLLRGGDIIMPLTRGLGLSPLPRPERFYFAVGRPIPTAHLQGKENDRRSLTVLRDEVSHSIYELISSQLLKRAKDRSVGPLRRLLNRL
jgi:1-acyl-sn-glycerol-3-phosphate acyltransferase